MDYQCAGLDAARGTGFSLQDQYRFEIILIFCLQDFKVRGRDFRPECSYEERGLNGTWTGEERGEREEGRGDSVVWGNSPADDGNKKDMYQRSEKRSLPGAAARWQV